MRKNQSGFFAPPFLECNEIYFFEKILFILIPPVKDEEFLYEWELVESE